MNAHEFKELLDKNMNVKLMVASMAHLVEEGYTPHEVFDIMKAAQNNTFHALAELGRERNQ